MISHNPKQFGVNRLWEDTRLTDFTVLSMPISLLSSIFVSTGDSPVSSEHQSYIDPNEAAAGFVCK